MNEKRNTKKKAHDIQQFFANQYGNIMRRSRKFVFLEKKLVHIYLGTYFKVEESKSFLLRKRKETQHDVHAKLRFFPYQPGAVMQFHFLVEVR